MIGSQVGHYRIVRLLGKGGMGEVYLADDMKLQRQVALKVLSTDVAADPDRRARFAREARAAAAFNHPNIVTIHSVEEVDGRAFLTLEYIDGQTLADLLPPRGMPLDRILDIGTAIADAVGAAHQRGITHRDLKPANVMIAADGRVKVLDFGLAKLREEVQPAFEAMPTTALTGEGRILGTVAYMSPEQAEGKPVDQRSDVFSLGVMLYEMAIGERPFKGDTQLSVLSSILRDNPPSVTDLKHELPRDLSRIIRRCLAKDPEDRYQTAKDLRNDLRGLREESGESAALGSSTSLPAPSRRRDNRLPIAAAAIAVATLAGVAGWMLSGSSRSAEGGADAAPFASLDLARLTATGTAGLAAISADGRYVAHVVSDERGRSLWLRQVATSSNVEIVPPAEVRYAGVSFSPDSNYVLYVTYPQGENFASLYQVPVLGGGARQVLYDIDTAPAFSPDGSQFAFVRGLGADATAIMTAHADGSSLHELVRRSGSLQFSMQLQNISWSPDGALIAAAGFDNATLSAHVVLVDVASGEQRQIPRATWRQVLSLAWLPDGTGLIVNGQEAGGESTLGQLWSVRYPGGETRRLTSDLSSYSGLSLSRDGRTLVTVRGEQRSTISVSDAGAMDTFRSISASAGADDGTQGVSWMPDGRLLYTSSANGNADIWVMNGDGGNRVQLTNHPAADRLPQATADGRYIVFMSERDGQRGIWRMDPSGNNQVRLGTDPVSSAWAPFVSPDGRWVSYSNQGRRAHRKIEIASGVAAPVFATDEGPELPPSFHDPALSRDGSMALGHYRDDTLRSERLAVVPTDDPSKARLFPNVFISGKWAPDGRSVIWYDNRRNPGNLWRQPIAGGPATQLTRFTNDVIFSFAFSHDGTQVAIARGSTISDVVLITSGTDTAETR
jgi:Tol biopolymer transport system component